MGALRDSRFGRVLTAMITPFDGDGRIDLDGAQRLAAWLVDHGSDGLVVNGTTGESPTLTATESVDLFRAVRQAVDVPVIAGTGSNDTAHAIRQSEAAAGIGVRSEEHTSELQSLMRISYAVFCLKKKKKDTTTN